MGTESKVAFHALGVLRVTLGTLYKKELHDPDNHDGVITHLEPDILECEVKWALESITTNKASGGDGIPVDEVREAVMQRGPANHYEP